MSDILDSFISPLQRGAIRAPIVDALTLPRAAYTSEQFLQLELEGVFRPQWVGLCHGAALPNVGDVLVREFFGMPLVLVRGGDYQMRVFHNVCPYDGCPVALESRREATELVVAYHGWRYDLQGRLKAIPYWDGSAEGDPCSLGDREGNLSEVRSATRFDVVFINLDGRAPAIDEHLAPVTQLLEQYGYDAGDLAAIQDDKTGAMVNEGLVVEANWKTYMENAAINILHESFTHASYNKSPEVPRVKNGEKTHFVHIQKPLLGFGYEEKNVQQTYDRIPMAHIGCLPGKSPEHGFFLSIYPNVVMPLFPEIRRCNVSLPEGPGRTRIFRCGYVNPDALRQADFEEIHAGIMELFWEALHEDKRVIEGVQKARQSPAWEQHFYAQFWDEQHYAFNNMILDDLENLD